MLLMMVLVMMLRNPRCDGEEPLQAGFAGVPGNVRIQIHFCSGFVCSPTVQVAAAQITLHDSIRFDSSLMLSTIVHNPSFALLCVRFFASFGGEIAIDFES